MTALLAMLLAGLSAALMVGGPPNLLRSRLGLGSDSRLTGGDAAAPAGGRDAGGLLNSLVEERRRGALAFVGIAGLVGATVVVSPLVGVVAVVGMALAVGFVRRRASARDERQRESDVVDACLTLAADLRAGVPVSNALATVSAEWPELLGPAAGRAAVGTDVAAALREQAGTPGAAALTAVAAGWEVSERTGAALASVLVSVADAMRADAAVRREAESQLATVRATSRLLALLPVGTLLLLSGGGGAPLRFLTSTSYGLACLGTAAALVASGLWWIDRLARSATRSSWAR